MRIVILGAGGRLGAALVRAYRGKFDVAGFNHAELDLSKPDEVHGKIDKLDFDVLINAAAFTNVDLSESKRDEAFAINAEAPRILAEICATRNAKLIHISTDYVFDGTKHTPYVEQDSPVPLNVYGNTKLSGECFVRTVNSRHFVVRVSAIYGANPCRAKGGLNFVELMLKLSKEREELRVVDDEFISPTPTAQIARQVVALSKSEDYGLYHATTEGSCSWYEFAAAIFELTGTKVRLERARPGEFPAKVPRPKYSVLENAALKSRSLNLFTHWREGLENYLAGRAQTKILSHV